MNVTFLGTGTSDGVPMIGCTCEVCTSRDKRDKRFRTSLMIENEGRVLLVDASMDFRLQMLRAKATRIDALFITHPHADHIFGLDELRQVNRLMRAPINIYTNAYAIDEIKRRFGYFFNPPQRGGGVANIAIHEFTKKNTFFGVDVTPLPVKHGILDIIGFRFNDLVYITDASEIPASTMGLVKGCDVLIMNALRYREHSTHFNLQQAVDIAFKIGARETYFIHLTHDVKHARLLRELPKGMRPAYDGQTITLP